MAGFALKLCLFVGSVVASFVGVSVIVLQKRGVDINQPLENLLSLIPLEIVTPLSVGVALCIQGVFLSLCCKSSKKASKKGKKAKKTEPVSKHSEAPISSSLRSNSVAPDSPSAVPVSTHAVRAAKKKITPVSKKSTKQVEKSPEITYAPRRTLPLITQNAFNENSAPIVSRSSIAHAQKVQAQMANIVAESPVKEQSKPKTIIETIKETVNVVEKPKKQPIKESKPVVELTQAEINEGWQPVSSKSKQRRPQAESESWQPAVRTTGRFDAFLV